MRAPTITIDAEGAINQSKINPDQVVLLIPNKKQKYNRLESFYINCILAIGKKSRVDEDTPYNKDGFDWIGKKLKLKN